MRKYYGRKMWFEWVLRGKILFIEIYPGETLLPRGSSVQCYLRGWVSKCHGVIYVLKGSLTAVLRIEFWVSKEDAWRPAVRLSESR